MTKSVLKVSAMLTAVVLTVMLFAALPYSLPAAAASGDKPVFTISSDREAAYTGSQVVVSVAVDNDTTNTITSFLGELRFDTRFFRYSGFEDQISMDGSVSVVADASANGKLSFVYTGKELTNTRINSGDSVVFIKFIFSVTTNYDTTGQFFVGTINDCYYDTVNIGVIDCRAPSVTVRSTTAAVTTQPTSANTQLSGDARLSSLTLEGCALSPEFNPEFVAYTASVPYEKASIRIDALTNSSGAIVSGLGIKDLAVGVNNFTVTVLAENGTMKEYGIIITRLEQTQPSESTTTVPSTTTTLTDTSSTEPISTTSPDMTTPSDSQGSTTIDGSGGDSSSDDILQVVGIVFGEIALFFFGFLSGFFVDKNLRRKGERREDDDYDDEYDYDDEDDYDAPTIYTPGENLYADGSYIDPAYQQPYAEPPAVDPQLVQYSQYLPQPMAPEQPQQIYPPFQQGVQMPPAEPQMGQYGEQPMYPPADSFDQGSFGGPYYT